MQPRGPILPRSPWRVADFLLNRGMFCRCPWLIAVFLFCVFGAHAAKALEIKPQRSSATDLEITGLVAGIFPGGKGYVSWADLRKLPTQSLHLDGEFLKGEQQVTILPLDTLWKDLPLSPGADTLFATCTDGYASIYTEEFIKQYQPFLILEIDGQPPEKWPPPGSKYNPGPFVILVSTKLEKGVSSLLDPGHKRPWGVTAIEIGNFVNRERGIYTEKWANLSPSAQAGREIWINSCSSCHRGPGNIFGGTKSDRPFEVLVAHARYNEDYFNKYVRNPQAMIAGAKMEAHPHYTDVQLKELVAFITADGK